MNHSTELFHRACQNTPGGVNSPVRALRSVDKSPIFFKKGQGAYLIDVDNKQYIDYVCSWGPLILGHCHPNVIQAIQQALANGLSFGAPCELEIKLAEKIITLMPQIDMIRMVNSGTEATMSAIRLARAYTRRKKIIKFIGCYHGHSDGLLVKAGSGVATLGIPDSPGVPNSIAELTLLANYNDLNSVKQLFTEHGEDIAAIIVEPVAGNMGCILPTPEFLPGLRSICDQYNSLLIFDEVMTGFRVALGGAQAHYRVNPDLTTLGKIIGGGMPVGAFAGRKAMMELVAPQGPVYQAGTLSGNPIAMAAGLATLNEIDKPGFHNNLNQVSTQLMDGFKQCANAAGVPFSYQCLGGLFGFNFSENSPTHYQEAVQSNSEHFKRFFQNMLQQGVYLAPSMFEAGFISGAHQTQEIELTLAAAKKAFTALLECELNE